LRDQESKRYRRKARIEIPTGGLTDEMSTEEDGRKNKKLFLQAPGFRTTGKQAGKKHMKKKTIFYFLSCPCNINCTVLEEKNKSFIKKC
jgi:hypothetical protein